MATENQSGRDLEWRESGSSGERVGAENEGYTCAPQVPQGSNNPLKL